MLHIPKILSKPIAIAGYTYPKDSFKSYSYIAGYPKTIRTRTPYLQSSIVYY